MDEDLPRKLTRDLIGHDVATVTEMRWNGIKNGVLLGLATSAGFNVFLTADRGIPHQQNMSKVGLAVIVLAVRDNSITTIRVMVPDILAALSDEMQPGSVTVIGDWRVD